MFKHIGFILSLFFISSAAVWGQATSDVYYQWGNKLYAQGSYDTSIKYYKAAVQVDPQNWKAYQALGSCEYHLGQKDQAIQDFNQSLALNPNNPPLQNFVNQISGGSAVPQAPAMASTTNNQISRPQVYGDSRLPKQGSISWEIESAGSFLSDQDLINDFAPTTVTFASEPLGEEFDLGADYTLSPNIQLGLQVQFLNKDPESISGTSTGYYEGYPYTISVIDTYTESCAGLAAEGKYLLPLSDQFRLIFEGQVGFYTLIGTTAVYEETDEPTITANLSSSALGGLIGMEVEWVMNHGGWAIDLGLGYRALTFGSITYTASSSSYSTSTSPQTLQNAQGGNFTLDFSGPRINVAVRFF
jgi:hypothetical protein